MVCECGTVITQDNGLLHCLTLDKLRVANLFHKVWDFRCKRRAALFERVNGCVVGLLSELLDLELFLLAQCLLNSALIELRVVRDNCLLVSVLVVVVVFKLGEPVELRQVLVELLLKQCCPLFGFLGPDLCLFDLSGFLVDPFLEGVALFLLLFFRFGGIFPRMALLLLHQRFRP